MEGIDIGEMANEAKARGNKHFALKTSEGYRAAITEYSEAIRLDPAGHVFFANRSACYIELGSSAWEPAKKTDFYAKALTDARACTVIAPDWAKGFVRLALAEFELVVARKKEIERKQEDEERAKKRADKAAAAAATAAAPSDSQEADSADVIDDFDTAAAEEEEPKPRSEELAATIDNASYAGSEASCRLGLKADAANPLIRTRLQALRDAGHATDEAADRLLRNEEEAAKLKAEGNAAFAAKRFKEARGHYTRALELDPFGHVFYSNRSACAAEEEDFDDALRDAENCIRLKPDFAKGFSRQALALFQLGRYPESEAAANAGLAVDAGSAALKDILAKVQIETAETPEVQKQMHIFRTEKRRDAKLQDLLKGLNAGGNGVQMFNGTDFGNIFNGGGGGMGGLGGGGGLGNGFAGKSGMTEAQMRQMSRAMSKVPEAN